MHNAFDSNFGDKKARSNINVFIYVWFLVGVVMSLSKCHWYPKAHINKFIIICGSRTSLCQELLNNRLGFGLGQTQVIIINKINRLPKISAINSVQNGELATCMNRCSKFTPVINFRTLKAPFSKDFQIIITTVVLSNVYMQTAEITLLSFDLFCVMKNSVVI